MWGFFSPKGYVFEVLSVIPIIHHRTFLPPPPPPVSCPMTISGWRLAVFTPPIVDKHKRSLGNGGGMEWKEWKNHDNTTKTGSVWKCFAD